MNYGGRGRGERALNWFLVLSCPISRLLGVLEQNLAHSEPQFPQISRKQTDPSPPCTFEPLTLTQGISLWILDPGLKLSPE